LISITTKTPRCTRTWGTHSKSLRWNTKSRNVCPIISLKMNSSTQLMAFITIRSEMSNSMEY